MGRLDLRVWVSKRLDRLARGSFCGHTDRSYRVGGESQKKANRWVDVPTLQLSVLRCDCAVGLVCDFCEVFGLNAIEEG